MATTLPSDDRLTDQPETSYAASPSISLPCFVQVPDTHLYTRTWPEKLPLYGAPMATVLPSDDRLTEKPERSFPTSPSISLPC